MRSKKVIINAVTIGLLFFYFILVMGSTPIIARFFIFNDDEGSDSCDDIDPVNTSEPATAVNNTSPVVSSGTDASGDFNADNNTSSPEANHCGTNNGMANKIKLALALVFAISMPCLLILLVKIARAVKSQNHQDTELQIKDILELAEVSEETGDIITQEQTDCIKQMVHNTWLYENRTGRDSRALRHRSLEVKQVVRVHSKHLWKLYKKGHRSVRRVAKYPAEVRENPILTMKQRNQQNPGENEGSEDQNEGSRNSVHDTAVVENQQLNQPDGKGHDGSKVGRTPESVETAGQSGSSQSPNHMSCSDNRQMSVQVGGPETELSHHDTSIISDDDGVSVKLDQSESVMQVDGNEHDTIHSQVRKTKESQQKLEEHCPEIKEQSYQQSDGIFYNINSQDSYVGQSVASSENRNQTSSFITNSSIQTCFNLNSNEVYLFHGTKLENIPDILQTGFKLRKARGGLYGKAIYLAESSEKADQYTDSLHNRRQQNLAMLVVRVAMGHVYCHDRDEVVVRSVGLMTRQSVVVAGINKLFREFLVFDPKILYPEFIVFYDRK